MKWDRRAIASTATRRRDRRRSDVGGSREKETGEPEKNPAAVALGRLGELKGGKARAQKLSPEKRREIARKAAAARWAKKKD